MAEVLNFSGVAFLLADNARAVMLTAMFDGRAWAAGELAYASGITAQTASSHLAKLVDGGLITVEAQGRHRYYRLAGPHVAQALEQLAAIQSAAPVRRKALSRDALELRFCRCCYDHLAGRVGVAITRALQDRDFLQAAPEKRFAVTNGGASWFEHIGLEVAAIKPTRRGLVRSCLDWTERADHMAGPLAARFLDALCAQGWLRRSKASRAITVTPKGTRALKDSLGVDIGAL